MALIYFYDATELDKIHLSDALKGTDHRWEYVDGRINAGNCNPDTEAVSVFISSTVSRECIDAMPKLKLIACRSTGFNHVDLDAARERGIVVVNVPTYGENTVAEYAFALLLALVRKLPQVIQSEQGRFSTASFIGSDLQGRVLGVIGTGHIGQKTLKIARGFSMETIAYDAYPRAELEGEYGFSYVGLEELIARADIISLHAPFLPSTKHLIDRERLSRMKPGAIIVNTARGELVDTAALVEALESGHLGGAALDVVEGEALLNYEDEAALVREGALSSEAMRHSVEISLLQKMPNVILTPHNAFNTTEAILRINQTTARNIIDFWYGKTPNAVQPSR